MRFIPLQSACFYLKSRKFLTITMGSEDFEFGIINHKKIWTMVLILFLIQSVSFFPNTYADSKQPDLGSITNQETYLFFDEFSGNTLDSSLWNSEIDQYSTISVDGGILTLDTDTPREWHAHEEIGFGEITFNHGQTYGLYHSNAVTFAALHTRTYTSGMDILTRSIIPPSKWFIGEIHWVSDSEVKFKIDNNEFTHNTAIPNTDLPILIFTRVIYPGPGTHFGAVVSSTNLFGKPGISLRMKLWMAGAQADGEFSDGGTIKCDWIYVWNSSLQDPDFWEDNDGSIDNSDDPFESGPFFVGGTLFIILIASIFMYTRRNLKTDTVSKSRIVNNLLRCNNCEFLNDTGNLFCAECGVNVKNVE